MPARKLAVAPPVPAEMVRGLAKIRAEMEVPDSFPDKVLRTAEEAIERPDLPSVDRTDLELLTIDPPGSRDLDQALHISRAGDGFLVSYAIADVAAFVEAADQVDSEAHRRGATLYAPDTRTLLHPAILSEGGASLLAGQVRPALLWQIRLDSYGVVVDAAVARAMVRSRAQLTYAEAQSEIDSPQPRESLALLKEVGLLRQQVERDRGGVSLQIPEQEIEVTDAGWTLRFRAPMPVEDWNAQISLMTGMAAAEIMLYGQVGILRTMPPADHSSLRRLRNVAKALHILWPAELDYPEFVRGLDPSRPDHAAMLTACTVLFRGAGYAAFSGGVPEQAEHSALAAEYAHATAPLRRLVDRYVGEVCVALCADGPVPPWVLQALDALPDEMAAAGRRASQYERAIIDLTEVFVLRDRVGEVFTGTVVEVDADRSRGEVMIKDPAIEARLSGDHLPLGHETEVRLVSADLERGAPVFELA